MKQRTKPIAPEDSRNKLIVLTQECDIAQGREIELALAKPLKEKKIESRYKNTKNLQCLHLPFEEEHWEIKTNLISLVPAQILLQDEKFTPTGLLDRSNLDVLKTWRVQSYLRDPLPDNL